jgi:TolB-like protein/tetratricopeptide (TPR) repeat protein
MTLSTGARLGPYEILAPIGAGGMGEVYRAKDPRLGRDVAIKVLPGSFSADKDRLRRFEQEARAAGILNHPNITAVYDIGTHEGAPYVVQELLEGETLRSSLAGGRLPPRKAIDYALQIAHGLAAAHEKRIVHRDLKPENLFVTKDGRVKILDFGLAKLTHTETGPEVTSLPTATAGTEPGVVMGTLGYMSPEQLRGEAVDARSDIFSFGAILYEMLSGRRAFRGATAADTISAILREEPAELSQSAPNVPPSLERVVRHCLEKSPAARFHSAPDVAFALEESASGSAAAPAAARPAAEVRRRGQRLALAGAAIAILVGILVGVRPLLERLRGGPGARAIQSIAVLPFENFSRDPEQEYFADGMTEELITGLAQIRSLRVISRTSAMQYKGTKKRIPEIGRELNVDAVLEGSVQRSGQRVRVTAQLIRASMDQHLWARSYERDLRDVLGLQSEVAAAVAHEVRVTLTPEEKVRLTQARPTDPEAHELYLKGRFHWNKGTEADLVEAIRDFESALARNPGYAPAYAGIADAYASLSDVYRPPYEVMPKARAAATKALQLDETLADTHVSLANIQFNYDRDWAAAEREARRALELNPNSAGAHDILGTYFAVLGRAAESAAEAARCLELDPLSVVFTSDAGWGRLAARDYDHAIEFFRKAVEIEPGFGFAHEGMAIAYVQKGRCPEAIAVAEKGTQADDSPFVLATSGGIYAACGKSDRAREVLKKLAGPYRNRYVCPYEIAVIHIGLGEKDEAFRSFEKGLQDRSICMPFLKVDPRLDPIRSDPRYVELVRRLAFPP